MKISEMFDSIQGEGPNAGEPVIFIRLALCNLTCSWCDTKYTWDWDNYDFDKEVHHFEIEDIIKKIQTYKIKHIVITGGEPLMQQEELIKLLSPLKNNYFIEVETNCTIIPNESLMKIVDQWNVSPKTKNSGNLPEQYENKESYNFFTGVDNCYFKFVVENEEDLTEIQKLINKYNIKKDSVFLMPQATTKMEIITREEIVSKSAKNHKFRYSPRMHVSMWGNQRGK